MSEATRLQNLAARPDNSTLLSANAGSGKTRVLTNRVARLLFIGAAPENILCLTYTKAAASEMQNRLFETLGAWAMASDSELRLRLAELGIDDPIDDRQLARARTLFARAIEAPGGLRIQTIHAFCASILRRFPLEAGVSPDFREIDDRERPHVIAQALDAIAANHPALLTDLTSFALRGKPIDELAKNILDKRAQLRLPVDMLQWRRELGLSEGLATAELPKRAIPSDLSACIATLSAHASVSKSGTDRSLAGVLAQIDWTAPQMRDWELVKKIILTDKGVARARIPPTASVRKAMGAQIDAWDRFTDHALGIHQTQLALELVEGAAPLNAFAHCLVEGYHDIKQSRGLLDYDDLILRTRSLLRDPALAQWVLYRLDGGIDHILVDEAQDTSPAQWEVIGLLAQEFTAGEGSRENTQRTIFVVGDKKQSIYSFQGAAPEQFDAISDKFDLGLAQGLTRCEMRHSFRSSPAILRAVDAVFVGAIEERLGATAGHVPFYPDMPGRVDLWPVVAAQEKDDDAPWDMALDQIRPTQSVALLAKAIAQQVHDLIDMGAQVTNAKGETRSMHAGDVLILVRKRGKLFHELIHACKRAGLPIAGADTIELAQELAVQDIRAILAFLDNTDDDLALACALRTPIFGFSEDALFKLAHKRGGQTLWQRLRATPEHESARAILSDLLARADFLRPYELIVRILDHHGGRAKLLGRLGPEAGDSIEAFLTQSLQYESGHIPSLTGFLAWTEDDTTKIKRSVAARGAQLRVMTVHGAKGLEAPIVILPDTLSDSADQREAIDIDDQGRLFLSTSKEKWPPNIAALKSARAASAIAERARLLYVAMTRAESWLIICGARGAKKPPADNWYDLVEQALTPLASDIDTPIGVGKRLAHGKWPQPSLVAQGSGPDPVYWPEWIDTQPPAAPSPKRLIMPSELGGAKVLPDPNATEQIAEALEHGQLVHMLIDKLADHRREDWAKNAVGLAQSMGFSADAAAAALPEAQSALDHMAHMAHMAGEAQIWREVPFVTHLSDADTMTGVIDWMRICTEEVLIVDFKTNRLIPDKAEQTPLGLLRQMSAYRVAMAELFPTHQINAALFWTRNATLMDLPAPLLDAAWSK